MTILLPVLLAAQFPFHAEGTQGTRSVEIAGGTVVEVITSGLESETDSLGFSYLVEGVRMAGTGFSDTLFWLAELPEVVLAQTGMTGVRSFYESRTMEILVLDESCIGGVLTVVSSRNGRDPSRFRALRTWLWGGDLLDLESVIQVDSAFYAVLSDSLGLEPGSDVETELWLDGFWLDPQSFLLIKGTEEPPVLRVGLPSTGGSDTLLVVSIPFSSLNSASGAMMD